jgi:hypothetical protein
MRGTILIFAACAAMALAGCSASKPSDPPAPAQSLYTPTSTIKDIMDSMVDPNADLLWGAVSTTITAKGSEVKEPQTDEDWKEVRRHAITLFEATNLLVMPGRHVAKPGEKADNPGIEEPPEEIEALINKDRATFENRAHGLREAAAQTIAAIDAKDPNALVDATDGLDKACEACHLVYWYPKDKAAQKLYKDEIEGNIHQPDQPKQ